MTNEVTLGNLLTIVAIAIALFLYLLSQRTERKLQTTKFVRDFAKDFYERREVSSLFREIDYEKFKFDDTMINTPRETTLLHLLDILDFIAVNCKNRVIKLDDIKTTGLEYAIIRVYNNSEIQKYLKYLDDKNKDRGIKNFGYNNFKELGKEL